MRVGCTPRTQALAKQAWARAGRAMNIETRWDSGAGSLGFLIKHRPDAGVNRCSEDIWALACQRAADHGGDAALSPRRLPHVSGVGGIVRRPRDRIQLMPRQG